MSMNKRIHDALASFNYPIVQGWGYEGTSTHWFSFNEAYDRTVFLGDNESIENVIDWQVHFFLPDSENYLTIKKNIRNALHNSGFTYPGVTIDTDYDTHIRHIVFEFQGNEPA